MVPFDLIRRRLDISSQIQDLKGIRGPEILDRLVRKIALPNDFIIYPVVRLYIHRSADQLQARIVNEERRLQDRFCQFDHLLQGPAFQQDPLQRGMPGFKQVIIILQDAEQNRDLNRTVKDDEEFSHLASFLPDF